METSDKASTSKKTTDETKPGEDTINCDYKDTGGTDTKALERPADRKIEDDDTQWVTRILKSILAIAPTFAPKSEKKWQQRKCWSDEGTQEP